MKTSVYVTDAKVLAACKELGKTNDIGVMFDKVDHEFGLKHDDLARAMYVALECGTDDKENVRTLLSKPEENMLRDAYLNNEIGVEYLKRWMRDDQIEELDAAKAAK